MKLPLRQLMLSTALAAAPLVCLITPVVAQQEIDPDHFDGTLVARQAYTETQLKPRPVQRTSNRLRAKKHAKHSALRSQAASKPKLAAATPAATGKK